MDNNNNITDLDIEEKEQLPLLQKTSLPEKANGFFEHAWRFFLFFLYMYFVELFSASLTGKHIVTKEEERKWGYFKEKRTVSLPLVILFHLVVWGVLYFWVIPAIIIPIFLAILPAFISSGILTVLFCVIPLALALWRYYPRGKEEGRNSLRCWYCTKTTLEDSWQYYREDLLYKQGKSKGNNNPTKREKSIWYCLIMPYVLFICWPLFVCGLKDNPYGVVGAILVNIIYVALLVWVVSIVWPLLIYLSPLILFVICIFPLFLSAIWPKSFNDLSDAVERGLEAMGLDLEGLGLKDIEVVEPQPTNLDPYSSQSMKTDDDSDSEDEEEEEKINNNIIEEGNNQEPTYN